MVAGFSIHKSVHCRCCCSIKKKSLTVCCISLCNFSVTLFWIHIVCVCFQHLLLPSLLCVYIHHLIAVSQKERSHQIMLMALRNRHQNLCLSQMWCYGSTFARLSKGWKGVPLLSFSVYEVLVTWHNTVKLCMAKVLAGAKHACNLCLTIRRSQPPCTVEDLC